MIDTDTINFTKVRFKNHQQALAQVSEDNKSLKQRITPTIVESLINQTADPYCIQAAQSVGKVNFEYGMDKNRLVVRMAPNDGTVQILVPQAL